MMRLAILVLLFVQDADINRIMNEFEKARKAANSFEDFQLAVDKAHKALAQILKAHSGHARATFHLAEMNLFRQDYAKAAAGLETFLSKNPDHGYGATARYLRAECRLNLEQDEAARKAFIEFLEKHPKDSRKFNAKLYLALLDQYAGKFDEAIRALKRLREEFRGKIHEWAAIMYLSDLYQLLEKKEDFEIQLRDLIANCKKSRFVRTAKKYAFMHQKFLGKPAPLTGLKLNQYRGKVVVLHFFSLFAPASEMEFRMLKRVKKLAGGGVQFVGVCLDGTQNEFDSFLKSAGSGERFVYEGQKFRGKIARKHAVVGFPHCVVLDKKGTIRYFNLAGRGLHQAIARLTQEK